MNAGQPERATRLPESARWGVLYPRAPRSSADRLAIRDESRCDDAIRTQKTPRAVCFRDDPGVEIVAFTATRIPGISGRVYPRAPAGSRYPGGIPIRPETLRGDVERDASTRDVLAAAREAQLAELGQSINATPCDGVMLGTPALLEALVRIERPTVRVGFEAHVVAGS